MMVEVELMDIWEMRLIRAKIGNLTGAVAVALLASGLFVPTPALAAIGPAEPTIFDNQFMPRSPLVARLQTLFAELKIYSGVIDGRLNDELTSAVRHYQSRSGLNVDGKVTEELLAHVEFKSQAEQLLVRLDTVGSEQRAAAREKLQSAALTRNLLTGELKSQTANPTRNKDICFQAPTIDCLITEAVESAKAVGRPHFRDWTFGEIAAVQAGLGQVEAARKTAGRISDPRLILVTLRNIAVSLAKADKLDLAKESASIIPDNWLKAEALAAVAVAQTRNGDWSGARLTMQDIGDLIEGDTGSNADFRRSTLLAELARKLAIAGDPTFALRLLEAELDRVDKLPARTKGASAAVSTLAAAFADIDQPDKAASLLDFRVDLVHRRSVSVALAKAHGRAGQGRSAVGIINALEEPRYRAVLLADIATMQWEGGEYQKALISLERAEAAANSISPDQKFATNHAWQNIAIVWAQMGKQQEAQRVTTKISDPGIGAGTWWSLSLRYRDQEKPELAVNAQRMAEKSLRRVKSSLDRVWLYSNRVQILAARKEDQLADHTFRLMLATVRGIKHSWTRAQALAQLVRAFAVLRRPVTEGGESQN